MSANDNIETYPATAAQPGRYHERGEIMNECQLPSPNGSSGDTEAAERRKAAQTGRFAAGPLRLSGAIDAFTFNPGAGGEPL